jgi:superoxide reductase
MKRRDFMKTIPLVLAGILTAGGTPASERGKSRSGKLNRLTNRSNPTVLEQKHVPKVDVPSGIKANEWFDIKVRVGFMKEHPSTPEHWITKIQLLVDGQKVAKEKHYIGGMSPSEAVFRIRLKKSGRLEAIEHCNLHGTWISEPVQVTVSQT